MRKSIAFVLTLMLALSQPVFARGTVAVSPNPSVSITSTVPGTGATNLGKAEDGAAADGDTGVAVMVTRKGTPANTSGTDGDYETPQIWNGRIWTITGYSFSNLKANATTTIKSGAGVLHTVSVNTKGITNTVAIYDNTAGSGTLIGTLDTTLGQDTLVYDAQFTTGLTVVIAGGTAADVTFSYV